MQDKYTVKDIFLKHWRLNMPKQYARIFQQYKYAMQDRPNSPLWARDGNIGDAVQNLAVENIYHKFWGGGGGKSRSLLLVNRDEINSYDSAPCTLVMQAWFGHCAHTFPLPWSDKIEPIFIGFHLSDINDTREKFIAEKIYLKMKPFEPIGCRDRNTMRFLQKLGVEAYFSGCMTLTFDTRKNTPENGKVFVVDLTKKAMRKLPQKIKETADTSITHFYYWNHYPVSYEGALEFEQEARKILNRYRDEARLIITSRIHVAMPCIALGIPVIFIHENSDDVRFDVLHGILPIYHPRDMVWLDWNPKAVNIDKLKSAIIKNAMDRIAQKPDTSSIKELNLITDELERKSKKTFIDKTAVLCKRAIKRIDKHCRKM
ncbi:MAG: polysaccharide pyruvyl transferase family protein [Campylobacteraceae bacterium]|nr:polysaccharide pyruvyl transferase family protein [Campylobacteraceae bacterium]